jgi:hypothetical protein
MFADYATSCLAVLGIIAELYLTLQRLFKIMNNGFFEKIKYLYVFLVIGVVSLLFYVPVLFLKQIVLVESKSNNRTRYQLQLTEYGFSEIGKATPIVLSFIRIILVTVVLLCLNVATVVKFKKYLDKKKNLLPRRKFFFLIEEFIFFKHHFFSIVSMQVSTLNSNTSSNEPLHITNLNSAHLRSLSVQIESSKASKNITLMMISNSFLYTIGNIPWAVYYALNETVVEQSDFLQTLGTLGISSLFLIAAFKLPVFYTFNRLFRQQMNSLLRKVVNVIKTKARFLCSFSR